MDEMGKGLQARDRDGRTALHVAVSRGHVRCVKALVERGAEKDVRSHDGRTALHLAAVNGDAEMVALLVEMGADPTVVTDRGMMPVDAARDKGYVSLDFLLNLCVINLWLFYWNLCYYVAVKAKKNSCSQLYTSVKSIYLQLNNIK